MFQCFFDQMCRSDVVKKLILGVKTLPTRETPPTRARLQIAPTKKQLCKVFIV